MKKITWTLLVMLSSFYGSGQNQQINDNGGLGKGAHDVFLFGQNQQIIDSLKQELRTAKTGPTQASITNQIALIYRLQNPDSGIYYATQGLKLARKYRSAEEEGASFYTLGFTYTLTGNFPQAIEMLLKAKGIAEKNGFTGRLESIYTNFGSVYLGLKDYPKALYYLKKAFKFNPNGVGPNTIMTRIYTETHQFDLANQCAKIAFNNLTQTPRDLITHYRLLRIFGRLLTAERKFSPALDSLKKSYHLAFGNNDISLSGRAMLDVANVFKTQHQADSAQYYAIQSLLLAQKGRYYQDVIDAGQFLSTWYEPLEPQKALYYSQIASAAKDSLLNANNRTSIQNLFNFDTQERQYEIKQATTAYQNKVKVYALIIGLAVMLLIGLILLRTYRKESSAKMLLQKKNEAIEATLSTLKSTQTQLIQSEKLASLGELTAGIAHEIQNPLNFVNNFAEVSAEMLDEMHEELEKGDTTEAIAIAADLKTNLEKINHHGQRASSIVKGMLEHSRVSTGVKEPTDVNALADEFLRLAYHGLRAKDNNFNATMETHFDPDLPLVSVIPQDIGRVLLNLINNAFYAVNEKAKMGIEGYSPTVSVSTKKMDNTIEISVKDNGNGIPDAIKDKIFQPFFTTKPTGQGTGLGLSLAYDIVTKGHAGAFEVVSIENEGAEFIIRLPLRSSS
jgi:two-component system, NtrC family, sensor kinase